MWFALLPMAVLASSSPSQSRPRPELVACQTSVNGQCVYQGPSAGNGGAGGNASVNIYVVTKGGEGGAGGSVTRVPPPMPAPVNAKISRCALTIAGQTVVDATQCDFTKSESKIAVRAPSENGKYVYEASILIQADNTGIGALTGGAHANTERSLGRMTRSGACWLSTDESVRLCAWR